MDPRKVLELYEEVESEREVARRLGVSRRQVRRALGRATDGGEGEGSVPHTGGVSQHYKEDGTGTVESRPGATIKTLEQLVNACAIDLTRYRVKQHVINKWETGARDDDGNINIAELFQVKAWLEEKRDELELLRLKEQLIAAMESHAPKYSKIRRKALATSDRYLLQVCPVDLHLGKLAWAPEVHGEHYDTTIACRVLRGAIDDLIARVASYQVERVLLVVGNDLLNADNPQNTTTAGTPQDVDGRHAKVFRRGWELMVETIDRLRGVAPVTVKVVPGNHDEDASFKLGEVLAAWYRKDGEVEIDNQPRLRKFFEYGPALVMLTHGKEEKLASLPMVMANEVPEAWGRTRHHEVHLGHFHKRAAYYFVGGDTVDGVVVRVLPSLCNTDEFHYRMGYLSSDRAMEAHLWSSETGYAGHISVAARPDAAASEAA